MVGAPSCLPRGPPLLGGAGVPRLLGASGGPFDNAGQAFPVGGVTSLLPVAVVVAVAALELGAADFFGVGPPVPPASIGVEEEESSFHEEELPGAGLFRGGCPGGGASVGGRGPKTLLLGAGSEGSFVGGAFAFGAGGGGSEGGRGPAL